MRKIAAISSIVLGAALCTSVSAQTVSDAPAFDTTTMTTFADYAAGYTQLEQWTTESNTAVLAAEQVCLADTTQTADACTAVKKADLTFIASGYKATDKVLEKGANAVLRAAKQQIYGDIKTCITTSPSTVLDPTTGRITSYDRTELLACFATAKTALSSIGADLQTVRVAEKAAEQSLKVVADELRALNPPVTSRKRSWRNWYGHGRH